MRTSFAPFTVAVDGLSERIESLDQAAAVLDRLNHELSTARQNVDHASAAEMTARRRLGHATIQVYAELGRSGDWHELVGKLRLHLRTVQEFIRVANAFARNGVFDYSLVDEARGIVSDAVRRNIIEVDIKLRAALNKKTARELTVTNLRALATAHRKVIVGVSGQNPNLRTHHGMDAQSRGPFGQPTHEGPAVSGLQVEHGDKVVWSAQLGRWMVEIGEVLYELHEYTRVRKGETVTWEGGVTPAGYDDDDDDDDGFGDDQDEDPDYDGDEDDLDEDDDAAFADDDEPLEDDEECEDRESAHASNFSHATPSTTGDTDDEDESDEDQRGARGQQLTFAGLFTAADGIARAMADLTTKLQHDPLISQRDLDAAEHAVDDAKLAIAEARVRLTEERP